MNWARTVKLAELLLHNIQNNAATERPAAKETPMNDQAPVADPVAGPVADAAIAPTVLAPVDAATPTDATPQPVSDTTASIDGPTPCDMVDILKSAAQLAEFLSQNKDVLEFMTALLKTKNQA